MSIPIIQADDPLCDPEVRAIRDRLRDGVVGGRQDAGINIPAVVREVVADVQARGDQAVADLTERIEKVRLAPERFRVSPADIQAARQAADPDFLALVARAAENIRAYQESIRVRAGEPIRREGRELGVRYTPLDRVGVWVPGGSAVLISTLLMTAVPAQVAGVGEIALASPPTTDGDISPLVLAVAGELGIEEVYRVSGTAGLAAMAIGTREIPPVDKIVGPGNAFITEAKRQLFGRVGIDILAGPSEVLILADETADARWVAADLLAQAEHDPGSALLVTPSPQLGGSVAAEIDAQVDGLDRRAALEQALEQNSAVIVVPDLDAACALANDIATEHLQIITADDDTTLAKIRHAGAIFLGPWTPVPLGDYYAGPSHVLPTGGTARFFGPLSCNEFLKASSVLRYDRAALAADAPDVIDFATREGLDAHALALRVRQGS